jgi:integrase
MEKLLTVKEAADLLNCHPQSVYKNPAIPRLHIPGVGVRFNPKDIENLAQKYHSDPVDLDQSLYFKQRLNLHDPVLCDTKKSGGLREMAKAKLKSRYNLGYGSVYERKTKRGNARWYVDFKDSDGKRIQKLIPHARTQEEAALALCREVTREFDSLYRGRKKDSEIRFSDFVDVYLMNYARIKKRSWKSDDMYIRTQLTPFFGKHELQEITPLHVNQFMAKRQKDDVKNSTINRELTVLKKMLGLAMEWGYRIDRNPVKKGNFFSEEQYRRGRVLQPDEEQRLFEAAALHLRPILVCALATGMRYSEILTLTWQNVDMEKKLITIRPESSKSGKQRVIPVNEQLYGEFVRLKSLSSGGSQRVFLYEDSGTGEMRPVKTVARSFKAACRRAGIENMRFHDLRHTVGTRLIGRGVDAISVKNILGHANLKTTEIYLHASMPQLQAAVEKLSCPTGWTSGSQAGPLHRRDTEPEAVSVPPVTPSSAVN